MWHSESLVYLGSHSEQLWTIEVVELHHYKHDDMLSSQLYNYYGNKEP